MTENPKWSGWLFIAAALLAAANQVFPAGQLISRFLFAVAFMVLGSVLVARPAAE